MKPMITINGAFADMRIDEHNFQFAEKYPVTSNISGKTPNTLGNVILSLLSFDELMIDLQAEQ